MNNSNKILWLIIVLLVILNITTLGTIFYHNKQNRNDKLAIVLDENRQNPLTGRFFRQNLGFDDSQMAAFRETNREFQHVANNLIFEMDSLKTEMFAELNSAQPDTAKLNNLSAHLGSHHVELKNITNHYYLKIKSVCKPSQQERLQEAFAPLFRDGTSTNLGKGLNRKNGNGYRYRNGRGWRNQ